MILGGASPSPQGASERVTEGLVGAAAGKPLPIDPQRVAAPTTPITDGRHRSPRGVAPAGQTCPAAASPAAGHADQRTRARYEGSVALTDSTRVRRQASTRQGAVHRPLPAGPGLQPRATWAGPVIRGGPPSTST